MALVAVAFSYFFTIESSFGGIAASQGSKTSTYPCGSVAHATATPSIQGYDGYFASLSIRILRVSSHASRCVRIPLTFFRWFQISTDATVHPAIRNSSRPVFAFVSPVALITLSLQSKHAEHHHLPQETVELAATSCADTWQRTVKRSSSTRHAHYASTVDGDVTLSIYALSSVEGSRCPTSRQTRLCAMSRLGNDVPWRPGEQHVQQACTT